MLNVNENKGLCANIYSQGKKAKISEQSCC